MRFHPRRRTLPMVGPLRVHPRAPKHRGDRGRIPGPRHRPRRGRQDAETRSPHRQAPTRRPLHARDPRRARRPRAGRPCFGAQAKFAHARTCPPTQAYTYAMRRLGVTAARRVRAIWHTKVLRVPPAQRARSSLTIPSALTTPWAAGRTSTARDSPADPHAMMAACEADHTRAPDGAGDGSEAAPLMLHDDS